jgi:hypothetical protein
MVIATISEFKPATFLSHLLNVEIICATRIQREKERGKAEPGKQPKACRLRINKKRALLIRSGPSQGHSPRIQTSSGGNTYKNVYNAV